MRPGASVLRFQKVVRWCLFRYMRYAAIISSSSVVAEDRVSVASARALTKNGENSAVNTTEELEMIAA